jgi:hypothetical protein
LTVGSLVLAAIVGMVFTIDAVKWVDDRLAGGPNLTYILDRQLPATLADDKWATREVIPASSVSQIPPPGADFYQWIMERRGAQIGQVVARVQFTNPRLEEVRIHAVRAKIVERGPAYRGTCFRQYTAGGPGIAETEINLADIDPIVREPDGMGTGKPYFLSHGDLTMKQGETTALALTAFPARQEWAAFRLEVAYSAGGTRHTLIMDNKGAPLLVTARSALPYTSSFSTIGRLSPDGTTMTVGDRYEPYGKSC